MEYFNDIVVGFTQLYTQGVLNKYPNMYYNSKAYPDLYELNNPTVEPLIDGLSFPNPCFILPLLRSQKQLVSNQIVFIYIYT